MNVVPLFRFLAKQRVLHLGIGYASAATVSVLLYRLGVATTPFLSWLAWAIGVVGVSLLITVFIWYRGEDVLDASILLIIITGIGTFAAIAIADSVLAGSIGALVFIGAGAGLALVVRLALLAPGVVLLVWVGRRLRRFFAPETVGDEDLPY